MNKSSFFSGQPVFSQLIRFIRKRDVDQIAREFKADRYCKKFDTWHHLVTMLYSSFQHCTSLREVSTGMTACEGRLQSLNVKHFTRRSTLSDANERRSADVFEAIYHKVYAQASTFLSDSRMKGGIFKKLTIIDSTTISLFNDVLKGPGRKDINGKKKGGLKVHMAIQSTHDVPSLVTITSAATSDQIFTPMIQLAKGSYVVFDRGYNSYAQFNRFTDEGVYWITRPRNNGSIEVVNTQVVNESESARGILKDENIIMGHPATHIEKVRCRRIFYRDPVDNKIFEYITNNYRINASTVAAIYKQRWQIELLFKRLKQNMPLQYFLGDNVNAIKVQIWCTLLADLLLKIATCGIKRRWAFSNLASLIRLHLMNYTDLKKFLNNPDKAKIMMPIAVPTLQTTLFSDV